MTKIGARLGKDYKLEETADDKKFFEKRGAYVVLGGKRVGTIGVLHPEVLDNYQLKNPVSLVEIDFEPVWQFFVKNQ